MTKVLIAGKKIKLDKRDLIGQGGEGAVFKNGSEAVKIYFNPTRARSDKSRKGP